MDFNIRMFNPQPEPPKDLGFAVGGTNPVDDGRATYYKYKLTNVHVTSYSVGGG